MLETLLKFAGKGIKGVLSAENIPIVGDIIEERESWDGGLGKLRQVNIIRLARKWVRMLLILAAAYMIIKGDDEKAEKIQDLQKQIYFVNFDGMAQRLIHQYLTTDGAMSANFSGVGSFSPASPLILKITPPPRQFYMIYRLIVSISDKPIFADRYGKQPALANGILIRTTNNQGDITNDIIGTNPPPIKKGSDWAKQCFNGELHSGTMMDTIIYRWTFTEAYSERMISGRSFKGLYIASEEIGAEANNLEIVLQDDLTALDSHLFLVEGEWCQPEPEDYKYV